jgi:ParB family transcriptional regulator, chromosome partitioning protein
MSDAVLSPRAAPDGVLEVDVAGIIVGARHRRDMGDIAGLAESIADIGLLNPITIDENGCLPAGARGLAACKKLGLKRVEVKIVRCGDGR